MKLATLFISLFLTLPSVAQTFSEVKQHLADKDFAAIEKIVNKLPSKYAIGDTPYALTGQWIIWRDITPKFQEAVIELEDSYAVENKKGSRTISEYKLWILATNTDIINYRLAKKQMSFSKADRKTDIEWQPTDSFTNLVMLDSLKSSFKRTYNVALREDDLNADENIVGFGCGYSGEAPELMLQLINILDKKDYEEVDSWLRSANIEKQVYAIIALYNLKKSGRKLTEEQKRLIEVIKSKRGKVKVCRGCSKSNDNIGDIVKKVLSGRGV